MKLHQPWILAFSLPLIAAWTIKLVAFGARDGSTAAMWIACGVLWSLSAFRPPAGWGLLARWDLPERWQPPKDPDDYR